MIDFFNTLISEQNLKLEDACFNGNARGVALEVESHFYVFDHCAAVLAVLEKGEVGQTYNIGGNNENQNIEVAQTICDLLDEKVGPLPDGNSRRSLIRSVAGRPSGIFSDSPSGLNPWESESSCME